MHSRRVVARSPGLRDAVDPKPTSRKMHWRTHREGCKADIEIDIAVSDSA